MAFIGGGKASVSDARAYIGDIEVTAINTQANPLVAQLLGEDAKEVTVKTPQTVNAYADGSTVTAGGSVTIPS